MPPSSVFGSSIFWMQCGIQFTMSALARGRQNGLVIVFAVVGTACRCTLGGAGSAVT